MCTARTGGRCRKISNTQVRPDSVVIRYGASPARYWQPNDHGHRG